MAFVRLLANQMAVMFLFCGYVPDQFPEASAEVSSTAVPAGPAEVLADLSGWYAMDVASYWLTSPY